jgi:transcription factor TFIIIB component B''
MVTMYELAARNRRMGKTSMLEGKMKNADWVGAQARRKEEEQRMALSKNARAVLIAASPQGQASVTENADGDDINAQIAKASRNSRLNRQELSVRVVDGQHLVNPDSQNVNRHELANHDVAGLKEVDQGDLTRKFNSQSFVHMKRRDPAERIPSKDRWTADENTKFYECLSTFGTDFMVISKIFPGKSRRHIKAKFVREERAEPDRIRRALIGDDRRGWDLETYKAATGIEDADLRTLESMDEELEGIREAHLRELEAQREKTRELNQQRQLASEQFAA